MAPEFYLEVFERPSLSWTAEGCREAVKELRDVAQLAMNIHPKDLPSYQCLDIDNPTLSLSDKILVIARSRGDKRIIAFTSSIILGNVLEDEGELLHAGLTCITPCARSNSMARLLTGTAIACYMSSHRSDRLWVTSISSFPSTLGAFMTLIDPATTYPSPSFPPQTPPSPTHEHILEAISNSQALRKKIYVPLQAEFDPRKCIFKGAARGTVYQSPHAKQKSHGYRNATVDKFYRDILDIEGVDAMLQVGQVERSQALRYAFDSLRAISEVHSKL